MSKRSSISRFHPGPIPLLTLLACLLFLVSIGPCSTQGLAAQVTLAWDASTGSVTGYKLYYGTASRTYGTPVDVGNVTQYTLTGIQEGVNGYFAVTAYDANRNESAFSTELACFTLVPAPCVNGTISPSSAVVDSLGMSQTFTVTPSANYRISDVTVDGASVGAVSSYTFSNVTANHSISASFAAAGSTYTISASAGSNGSISPSGTVSVTQGASQTFAVTANSGYQIQDVKVDGTSVGAVASYTFSNVTATHTIAATFVAKTYAITASAGSNGSISPSGSVSVTQGASQTFAVTANSGYQIQDVKVDGTSVGAVASYTFSNVTATHTIAATFAAKTYAITASAGSNGSISPSGTVSVTQGASQAFAVTANSGYQILDVKVDGTSVGAVASYTFSNVTATHTIAASFTAKTYAITASAGSNGSISPSGTVSVTQGASQAFTITANTGYQIQDVLVDGTSVGAVASYTFSNVTTAHTIAATFAAKTYAVTASAGSNGSISPSGTVSVTQGASQAFAVTANSGYQIQDVKVDGTSVGAVASYTFSNVTATHTIAATFTAKTYAITASAGSNGSISPSGTVSVTQGASQTFAVTANSGYQIQDVLVDGTSVGAVASYTFSNVTATHTIAASFTAKTYAITASAGSNGAISPSGTVSVTQGASQTFAVTANSGYQIQDVKVDGTSVGAVASYTFSNVTATHTIAASFTAKTYAITSSAGTNGAISPSGSVSVTQGASQAFAITANTGYQIQDVKVDGTSVGAVASYTFSNVTATHTIAATFAAKTYAVTASAGSNGSISPSGSVSVTQGASQAFAVTANSGYQIQDVLVDGTSVGAVASYTFSNVTATHTIAATFAAKTYAIKASAGSNGSISPSGSVSVTQGASQAFAVTANSGYQIQDVLVDGTSVGAVASYTFSNVTATHTIAATFAAKTYAVTASAGSNGSISPSGTVSVTQGASQAFAVTANSGYQILDVKVDGTSVGAVASYTFSNVTATHTIAATFAAKTYAITASAGSNGSISPSGTVSVTQGASQAFTITANTGYQIQDVLVDGTSVGAVASYTFSNVTAAHTIAATFTAKTYAITASAGSNGSISPAGTVSVTQGASQAFAVTANTGYQIQDVLVDGTSVGAVASYTFSNVTTAHTIAATFAAKTYAITASAGSNGSISPSGTVSVTQGASQAFAVTANTGYQIQDVKVDGTSVGAVASYTFSNVTATHTIAATFVAKTYAITASAGSNGSISPSGSVSVIQGASQTFAVTANSGYQIQDVKVDGTSVGAVASYTFSNVTATHTIAASFTAKTYAITASAGSNGSISPSGTVSVTQGASQAFTITANTGYQIQDVLVNGTSVGAVASYTFSNVTATHTIAASFSPISYTYTISASAGAHGLISPAGTVSVTQGASQAFAVTANTGYQIQDVLVDGASVGAVASYTFSNVTATHTIAATFVAKTYAITASAGSNGAISPSGSVSVTQGTSKTFTIASNTGYQVKDVTVDGSSVGAVTSYTFSNVTAAHTIAASFAAKIHKITTSAGAHGKISPTESVDVEAGSSMTFMIIPDTGYQIKAVLVDGASVGTVSTYTFLSISASHTLSASFEEIPLSISASAGQGGKITPSGSIQVTKDSTYSFTITPDTGYSVQDVLVDGVSVGAVYQYMFPNVTTSHSITASFSSGIIISATSSPKGKITPSGNVAANQGSSLTFSLTPDADALIRDVLVDGVSVGKVNSYTFSNITTGHSISAIFGSSALEYPNMSVYSISASAGTNGSISPSGSVSVAQGASQIYSITADAGYQVQDVKVDGVSVGAVTSYTFSNITASHSIAASFAMISSKYTISASTGSGGSISPSGSVQVQKGTSKVYTITAKTRYAVDNVLVDGISVGAVTTYTFSNVQENHSISATFKSGRRNQKTDIRTTGTAASQTTSSVSSYLLAGSGSLPGSGGWIEVLNPQGDQAALPVHIDWPEYNRLSGEMRIASGDIDGDGRDEIVAGLGRVSGAPGIPGGYFAVLDDDYSVIAWGQVEWPEYNAINGETRPACGDIDGDGIAEIIVGLGPGGEGRLEVFKLVDHQLKHVKWLQTGWQDYNTGNGETRPACGDLDGNGTDEVIVGLGPVTGNTDIPGGVFFVFDQTSAGSADLRDSSQSDASGWGVLGWPDYNRVNGESWPACGDVNGDGRDEIVLGLGKEGQGRFEILGFDQQLNSARHIAWQQSLLSSGAEVHPACGRLDTDAGDDIVIGFSTGGVGTMEVFGGAARNFQSIRQVQTQFTGPRNQISQLWPAVIRLRDQ